MDQVNSISEYRKNRRKGTALTRNILETIYSKMEMINTNIKNVLCYSVIKIIQWVTHQAPIIPIKALSFSP